MAHLKNVYMITLQANFIEEITGLEELVGIEQLYFQQNKIKKISGISTLKKLEIFDVAVNEITEISGLEGATDTLDELWINNNQIKDMESLEYVGKTCKKLNGLYCAVNPVFSRGPEFIAKLREAIPQLKECEGSPFDRPSYMMPPQPNSIVKKGINPKAAAILQDIMGKQAAAEQM